jgi:tetratricopeptide (TPR) repeat protein
MKDRPLIGWMARVNLTPRLYNWYQVPGLHYDLIFIDMMRGLDMGLFGQPDDKQNNALAMERCWAISDKLPISVAKRISRDWEHAKTEAGGYERKYADDPLVINALARRYVALKRSDDAERCAKRLAEIHPGYTSYRLLASIYKDKKDHAAWKETLDKAIELPSLGLDRAQVQNQIALDLLERKEWKQAAEYADAAAESYSGWSMVTAARCHEMLGEWKKAERYVRAVSERYDKDFMDWTCWCHRTGHGDVRAADEFTRQHIEAWGTKLFPYQYRQIGMFYLLTGDPEKALVVLKRAFKETRAYYAAFHAALTADALGKTAERDQLIGEIIKLKLPKTDSGYWGAPVYQALAAQLREMLPPKNAKQLNEVELEKLVAVGKEYPESLLCYGVGAFLKNRGDLDTAKKYLIRCAHAKDWQNVDHALACQLLREMKVHVPPAP